MARTAGIAILWFGSPVVRHRELFDAALARIAESKAASGVLIVCPTPLVVAGALAKAGYHATVCAGSADAAFLRQIVALGAIPVLGGEQRDAIELANAIGDSRVIVYTESGGVMSANPEHVSGAAPVRYVSHVELMELADQRSSPVSDDAAQEAAIHGISYEVRGVTGEEGTVIRDDGYEDRLSPVTAISVASGYALVSMGSKPSQAPAWRDVQMRILERLADAGISIELLHSFAFGLRVLTPSARVPFLQALAEEFGLAFQSIKGCSKLCIVGTGVRTTAGVFYRGLRALADENIPVLHWSDSNVTLSFVVNEHLAHRSEQALHAVLAPGSDVAAGSAISFDADLALARVNGREIRLGARQAQLLRHLVDNVGRIVEAEELARRIFGAEGKEELAAVRVHLHNLRKKIEADPDNPRYIVTVPEQGYVFVR